MPRSQTIRLREAAPTRAMHEAKVIDAQFKVIGRKRRVLSLAWRAVIAVLWAAAIGFLIPPAWIFFESIGAQFASG